MATSRLNENSEARQQMRRFSERLKSSGKFDGLMARISFLTQPQELRAPMIERVIGSDPVFGPAIVRRFLDAASMDMNEEISSVSDAVLKVGVEKARRLLLTSAMSIWVSIAGVNTTMPQRLVVRHGLAIGMIASRFGAASKFTNADSTFGVAGSHAFGVAAMLGAFPEIYSGVWAVHDAPGPSVFQTEHESFGLTHGEAAAILMGEFGCNAVVADAHLRHHNPVTELKQFPLFMHVAEMAAESLGFGIVSESSQSFRLEPWLLRLGLSPNELPTLAKEIHWEAGLLGL